ncbi:hypothetical protein Mgra_00007981 [Meloidogyne graminicola]|uniref:BED-type domain-containing protein n=1 Tax=Meloidogyne graminicola TaxID=189291 RepID=A0A8S9ZH11_9BILA|nr:hypothetical protein Mgra_00007981 [Meloidogyne graminicola]
MDTDSKTAFICIQMKSHIWKIGVFKRINDTEAECRLCKENGESKYVLKISAGSVKGLITHLRSNIHKDSENAKEYERLVNNDQSTSGAVQIDKFFNQNSSGNLSQLDKKKLKDESHYRKIVPEVYKAVKHKIKLEIKECTLSFTTDIWSNKSHGFISLTAQGISKKWSFKNFTLAIREFSTSHTASNIENKLDEILKEWNIERDYIHAFVTDSASNMVKAFEKLSEVYCCVRFSCAAHLLNRAVQQSFGAKEGAISQLFASCRRVVSHVKYSIKAMNELRIIQIEEGIQQHQLLQAMSVRWNSTLIMIERLLEQRLAIDRMAFEKRDFEKITLSVGEWNLLEPLKQLLKPVEELSLLLCKSRISVIIPYAKAIVSTISKLDLRVDTENGRREIIEIEDMRRKLVEEISNRFFCLQEIRAHSISTFLDPRFKAEFLMTNKFQFTELFLG